MEHAGGKNLAGNNCRREKNAQDAGPGFPAPQEAGKHCDPFPVFAVVLLRERPWLSLRGHSSPLQRQRRPGLLVPDEVDPDRRPEVRHRAAGGGVAGALAVRVLMNKQTSSLCVREKIECCKARMLIKGIGERK